MKKQSDILLFIPTYNERENVENLYKEIKKLPEQVDILFLDDNSPDGTGAIVDRLASHDSSIHVIHRPKKLGLGTAHIQAFQFAQKNHYMHLITMDADFTHHPRYIPALLDKRNQAEITIGSRYISGGHMMGWGKIRLPFTYFWRNMIRKGLGMPYDCTGAFRLYDVKILKSELYNQFKSNGFSFCMESLYYFKKNGFRIIEIPIQANNRIAGKSKLSTKIMAEVARMYFVLLFDRLRETFTVTKHAKKTELS